MKKAIQPKNPEWEIVKKSVLKKMDAIYIATDPDREGEAIAWHLLETLKEKI